MRFMMVNRVRSAGVAMTATAAVLAVGAYAATASSGKSRPGASAPAASRATMSTRGFPSGPGDPGIFTERCRFSHTAADDPILMPGQTGMSMVHDFFGNVRTNAFSTAASLRNGATTCATSADASAYWIPQLYQNGRPVMPRSALIYWTRPRRDSAPVQSLPAGLEMIAGDEHATEPQGVRHVAWSCVTPGAGDQTPALSPQPHSCRPGQRLRLTVRFPSCWDGRTLAAARQSNVAYRQPRHGGCPAGYPKQIPQIVFHVTYPISDASGLSFSMAPHMSGSTDTAHVDFIDGWNATVLARDVTACLTTSTRCGPVKGPEAIPQGPAISLRR